MLRVLATLDVSAARETLGDPRAGYACAFALACSGFGVTADAAGIAYAYAWLENLVLAAVKLQELFGLSESAVKMRLKRSRGRIMSCCAP